jgi:hypothetical protein
MGQWTFYITKATCIHNFSLFLLVGAVCRRPRFCAYTLWNIICNSKSLLFRGGSQLDVALTNFYSEVRMAWKIQLLSPFVKYNPEKHHRFMLCSRDGLHRHPGSLLWRQCFYVLTPSSVIVFGCGLQFIFVLLKTFQGLIEA